MLLVSVCGLAADVLPVIDGILTWLDGKAGLISSGAAVVGVFVALLGLNKWLPELVGRRKTELAEDVLAGFYEARDAIKWARFPGGFSNEKIDRKADDDEEPNERLLKDDYYRTIQRVIDRHELFAHIQSKKYRAMAYFGPEAEVPFRDLKKVIDGVTTSASMLIWTFRNEGQGRRSPSWEKWEAEIGWGLGSDSADLVAKEVDRIIVSVESSYSPWLMRQ